MDIFDLITQETFAYGQNVQDDPIYQDNNESPGILYRIDRGAGTFCLRGSVHIQGELGAETLSLSNPALLDQLKLDSDHEEKLHFFKTESREEAEEVFDGLFNRRFPYMEDIMCNLSDPGFSWWLNDDGNSIRVHFKSYSVDRSQDSIKLGPIADNKITIDRLTWLGDEWISRFSEFSFDNNGLIISSSSEDQNHFQKVRNLFIEGEFELQRSDFDTDTLYYFFKELAVKRKFWINLENLLKESIGTNFWV